VSLEKLPTGLKSHCDFLNRHQKSLLSRLFFI